MYIQHIRFFSTYYVIYSFIYPMYIYNTFFLSLHIIFAIPYIPCIYNTHTFCSHIIGYILSYIRCIYNTFWLALHVIFPYFICILHHIWQTACQKQVLLTPAKNNNRRTRSESEVDCHSHRDTETQRHRDRGSKTERQRDTHALPLTNRHIRTVSNKFSENVTFANEQSGICVWAWGGRGGQRVRCRSTETFMRQKESEPQNKCLFE